MFTFSSTNMLRFDEWLNLKNPATANSGPTLIFIKKRVLAKQYHSRQIGKNSLNTTKYYTVAINPSRSK